MQNQKIYQNAVTPTRHEAKTILKILCDRGIVVANRNDTEARATLIELGLTMPKEKDHWLVFDSLRENAMYIFLRIRNPARSHARPDLVALKFDYAKYRRKPLAPNFGAGEAFGLFERALAAVTGLDLTKFKLAFPKHSHN